MLAVLVVDPGAHATAFPGLDALVAATPPMAVGLAGVFALCMAVFVWGAAGSLLLSGGYGSDVARKAVALSVLALALVCLVCHETLSAQLFEALGLYVAGLGGTFAAIAAERLTCDEEFQGHDAVTSARVMALNAVHDTLLGRISGRGETGRV